MMDAAGLHAWGCVPESHRLGVMTVSGGAGVLIADAAEKEGLALEPFEPATRERLTGVLPAFAKPNNPIDLTAAVITDRDLLAGTLAALCADATLGVRVLFIGLLQSIAQQVVQAILAEREVSGKPVIVVWFGAGRAVMEQLEAARIPVFPDVPQAVRAIGLAWKARHRPRSGLGAAVPAALRRPVERLEISEAQAKRMLASWDIVRVPEGVLVADVAQGREAVGRLEPPLAAKLQSPRLKHKSEHGAVVLRIASHEQALEVASELTALGRAMGLPAEGVLVERMVPFDFELVVGMRHDPQFGPVMVLGRGGVSVEADPDVATLLMPVTQAQLQDALQGLRHAKLLKGFRGGPAIDFDACARSICQLATRFLAQPDLLELEINPLAVRGGQCWALDAVATLETKGSTI